MGCQSGLPEKLPMIVGLGCGRQDVANGPQQPVVIEPRPPFTVAGSTDALRRQGAGRCIASVSCRSLNGPEGVALQIGSITWCCWHNHVPVE